MSEQLEATNKEDCNPRNVDPEVRANFRSAEDTCQKHAQLIGRLPGFPIDKNYTGETNETVEELNLRRAAVVRTMRHSLAPIIDLASELCNPSQANPEITDLWAAVKIAKQDRKAAMEEALNIASAGEELAPRCAAELEPVVEKLGEEYEQTLEAVRDDLERIGQGISATQAGQRGSNGAEAERQLVFLAKNNDRSRNAWAALVNARNQLAAVKQSAITCKTIGKEIQVELTRMVAREMSM